MTVRSAGSENPEAFAPVEPQRVSKSEFKARALRRVEKTGEPLIITGRGRPVMKIVPYLEDPEAALRALRGSVFTYDRLFESVGLEDWEALR